MSNANGHRWSKFWWHDWDTDKGLRSCSFAAQGLWMRLLCVMHDADPVGHLVVNGRAPSIRQIVDMCGGTAREVTKLMHELEANGVFSRTTVGNIIYNRRMVKDAALSDAGRHWGKRGGNPILTKTEPKNRPKEEGKGVNPPTYPGAITEGVNHPGYPGALTEGVGQTLILQKLEADSEVESKKEREEVTKSSCLLSFPSPARESEPPESMPADRLAAMNEHRKLVDALNGKRGKRTLEKLFKPPAERVDELSSAMIPEGAEIPCVQNPRRTPEQMIDQLGLPPEVAKAMLARLTERSEQWA